MMRRAASSASSRAAGALDAHLVLDALHHDRARLVARELRDPLQLVGVTLHGLVDLGVAGLDLFLAIGDGALAAL